jgi:carbamoyl-phosphate synthase small subunit
MISENISGIYGIDTRSLTRLLAKKGNLMGSIFFDMDASVFDFQSMANEKSNLVEQVSCKEVITYNDNSDNKKVVIIDCGLKHNIIRCLIKRNLTIIRVPFDYDFSDISYDGIVISSGPGSPSDCQKTIENIKKSLKKNIPVYGIGLGHLLLSTIAGAKIKKMKLGHHGGGHPIKMVGTNNCFMTDQNHSYVIDPTTLEND